MAAEDGRLVATYVERKLLDAAKQPVHLPTQCPRHEVCWPESETRLPGNTDAATLSPPWIGCGYEKGRLVVVLENLRDFGGWDLEGDKKGMRRLGRLAQQDFRAGLRRVFRSKDYVRGGLGHGGHAGTNVWSQAMSYASTWLQATTPLVPTSWGPQRAVPTDVLADTVDLVAVVQHVKCSPSGERSRPTDGMWRECGTHVLRYELDILRPERLLVLGSGHNATFTRTSALVPGPGAPPRIKKVGTRSFVQMEQRALWTSDGRGHPVDVIVVPHPASPGGISRALVTAVQELVLERGGQ